MKKEISDTINVMRFFAVLSIICAHCSSVDSDYSAINTFCSRYLSSIGSIGVGVFFFLSGYLFHTHCDAFFVFIRNKIRILLPAWIFSGTLVYLYVYLRKGGICLESYIRWIVGDGSYLWYMSVLCFIYILFYFITGHKLIQLLLLCVSVLSSMATGLGLLYTNPYLNPGNFLIFPLLGLLVQEKGVMEELVSSSRKHCWWTALLLLGWIFVASWKGRSITYFKAYYIVFEILALFAVVGISSQKRIHGNKLFFIGKQSYSIYLFHMPVAGIVSNVMDRVDSFALTILRPLIVLAAVTTIIYAICQIIGKCPNENYRNGLKTVFGIR